MSSPQAPNSSLLSATGLKVHFPLGGRHGKVVRAADGVSFAVQEGTTFGIVGESGSGKSTTAMAIMRLLFITEGEVSLDGTLLSSLAGEELRRFRRNFQIIFQDPYSSLDPRRRVGDIVREPLDRLAIDSPRQRRQQVADVLRRVGLRPEQANLFPHQFSGGQRQRVCIARALASRPRLVVCDEPVSALNVAIQAQILNLLIDLQQEFGLTYLFISHDLGVVHYMCDEIGVMYLGQIVEQAGRFSLFDKPLHPYTVALLSAVPSVDAVDGERARQRRLKGDPPSPIDPPSGCRFHGRCPFAEQRCRNEIPELRLVAEDRRVACHRVSDTGEPLYDLSDWHT
jgi:peptide/nickel transport system ATP-binding protein